MGGFVYDFYPYRLDMIFATRSLRSLVADITWVKLDFNSLVVPSILHSLRKPTLLKYIVPTRWHIVWNYPHTLIKD